MKERNKTERTCSRWSIPKLKRKRKSRKSLFYIFFKNKNKSTRGDSQGSVSDIIMLKEIKEF